MCAKPRMPSNTNPTVFTGEFFLVGVFVLDFPVSIVLKAMD
jgi:hypothetical protein